MTVLWFIFGLVLGTILLSDAREKVQQHKQDYLERDIGDDK